MKHVLIAILIIFAAITVETRSAHADVMAVAETQSNGYIILMDYDCVPMWGMHGRRYVINDAFGNGVDDGCWEPRGKFIVGVNLSGNMQKWRMSGFKITNKYPDPE